MTLNRYATRRDQTEAEIIDALEALGFHVERLSQAGVPDLLMSRAGRWYVAEAKSPRGRETQSQVRFREAARALIPIFREVGDVIAWEKELQP